MTPPGWPARGWRWTGPALFVVGAAGAVAAFADSRPEKSALEFGAFYTLTRTDQVLPLLGVGIAAAHLPAKLCWIGVMLLAFGISAGGFVSDGIAAALSSHPGFVGYVFLVGPACCVIVGASLAAPRHTSAWLVPPAAFFSGVALGLVINFNDPSAAGWAFAGGAVLAGLWLVVSPLLVLRGFAKPCFSIPGRIFGSWLIAIGAMLGAAQLMPRTPAVEPPAANSEAPIGIEPPLGAPPSAPNPLGLPENVQ